MMDMLRKALMNRDSRAIDLVCWLVGKTKIVDFTDDQVKLLVKLMNDPLYKKDAE